jgi:SAM-dependent methyltransferase
MHTVELRRQVRKLIPKADVRLLPGADRFAVIDPLAPSGNVGIELGVAAGSFSARMVQSGRFARFVGVDVYADGHNTAEYKKALQAVGLWSDYRLLRMTFDAALDLFPDQSFDFIYCDGYAHTGEEGGRTLADWFTKLKPGGVMAGDDYDPDNWPLVVWAVHNAARQLNTPVFVTQKTSEDPYNRFPSWYFIRPASGPDRLAVAAPLAAIADAEKERVAELRRKKRLQRRAVKDSPAT